MLASLLVISISGCGDKNEKNIDAATSGLKGTCKEAYDYHVQIMNNPEYKIMVERVMGFFTKEQIDQHLKGAFVDNDEEYCQARINELNENIKNYEYKD